MTGLRRRQPQNEMPSFMGKSANHSNTPFCRAGSMVMIAEATKTKSGRVDWRTVRGLMTDAIYGGRVDNPHDMRVLATYLRRYFNSEVVSGLLLSTGHYWPEVGDKSVRLPQWRGWRGGVGGILFLYVYNIVVFMGIIVSGH